MQVDLFQSDHYSMLTTHEVGNLQPLATISESFEIYSTPSTSQAIHAVAEPTHMS